MSEDQRCLVIDAHPTLRLGVRELLAGKYTVEEAADGRDGLDLVTSIGDFDVAIVEYRRGNGAGDELAGAAAIAALRKAQPGLGIVAHGTYADRATATDALRAGATAYVAKSASPADLERAVRAAADAERFIDEATAASSRRRGGLTKRQREILQLIADGHSTARIARQLGLSGETVRTHTKAILSRLGARDRAHAVATAMRSGLIE